MTTAPRQADLVLARLRETPGEWVPMPELGRVSDSMNVHSRIDELRHGGHHIENRLQRRPGSRRKDSFYRLVIPQPETASHA